jgi:hypothetical protein
MAIFGERRKQTHVPVDHHLPERHRAIAERVAKATGRSADQVLTDAYRRADGLLRR